MIKPSPTVSVCLPVYNGERYVRETIDSVLAQTFDDLELVISDNASTDRTREICLAAAEKDARVRYFGADANRGLAWNYNHAFELASGRYLMWIGHDDLIAPDFIRQSVQVLQEDEGATVCFANADYIDAAGRSLQRRDLANGGAAATASERFLHIMDDEGCEPVCGLMKTEVLRRTRLHGAYAESDRVLLAEMGLQGRFRKLSEYLFSRRVHTGSSTACADRWERSLIFDPRNARKAICPWWLELFDLLRAIGRAPLDRAERMRSYKYLYWWAMRHKALLFHDLRRGVRCTAQRMLAG